ncbi:MAG: branched-chain amino acid ABC transporter permease [bacterium]|nr:branched-chain amino acid ABC transporter permease [bacterium]
MDHPPAYDHPEAGTMLNLAVTGIASGVAYAAIGVCLVLIYQISNLINVSMGIVAGIGAFTTVSVYDSGVSLIVSGLVGVAVGALVAAAQGLIFAFWFSDASTTTRTAVSIAMTVTLLAAAQRLFGHDPRLFPLLLDGRAVTIGSVRVQWVNIIAVFVLVLVAAGLRLGQQHTRMGAKMRAVSLRPQTAELLGVRSRRIVVGVWACAGAAATAGLLVVTPTRQSDLTSMTLLVVPALAAALLGGLKDYRLVIVAGLAIGLLEALALSWDVLAQYRQALSFLVIVVGLLFTQRAVVWDERR